MTLEVSEERVIALKQAVGPTPGPWIYDGNKLGIIKQSNHAIVALTYGDVDESGHEVSGHGSCLRANGRLIAAAPDLLASLEAIVARWDTPAWKDAGPTADVIAQGRAAIAKATAA